MKSATVTWITYNNYGTELQAFALQQFVLNIGIENVIISDELVLKEFRNQVSVATETAQMQSSVAEKQNENNKSRIHLWIKKYLFNPKGAMKALGAIINAYKRIFSEKIKGRKCRFYTLSQEKINYFKREKLDILYNVAQRDMVSLNDKFDVFICGSDQIWSPLDYNFNGYYYLDFVNKKKFSYATSLGTTNISEEKLKSIQRWTKDYHGVSVRESTSAIQLSELLDRNVEWVLDPTLLLDQSFWKSLSDKCPVKKKYVVCYFLEFKEWYLEYAEKLSKFLGVKLYIIPSTRRYAQSKYCIKKGIGPEEFIGLIAKSEFVLTDSYHASIFSLIFEKNFLYLKRFDDKAGNSQNIRIYSLFELLNIEKLIIEEKSFSKLDIVNLDYSVINKVLEEKRVFSQNYLKGCLL